MKKYKIVRRKFVARAFYCSTITIQTEAEELAAPT